MVIQKPVDPVVLEKWNADSVGLFNKFRGQMLHCAEVGMDPDSFVTDEKGGYYTFFVPNNEVTYAVERIGREIHRIAPEVLAYPGEVLHTTFTDYKVASRFYPPESPDHRDVVEAFGVIASGIADLMKHRATPPAARYGELLFSLNTFMLEGFAMDASHLEGALYLQEKGKELLGTELRLPWGSHISFGRVAKRIEPVKVREIIEFCNGLKPLPADRVYPFAAVEAGWYTMSPKFGFQGNITHSFPI